MQVWLALAIGQLALGVISAWRIARAVRPSDAEPKVTIRWSGLAVFVIATLAIIVLIGERGPQMPWAVVGAIIHVSDVVLLRSTLVLSLCTGRAAE